MVLKTERETERETEFFRPCFNPYIASLFLLLLLLSPPPFNRPISVSSHSPNNYIILKENGNQICYGVGLGRRCMCLEPRLRQTPTALRSPALPPLPMQPLPPLAVGTSWDGKWNNSTADACLPHSEGAGEARGRGGQAQTTCFLFTLNSVPIFFWAVGFTFLHPACRRDAVWSCKSYSSRSLLTRER